MRRGAAGGPCERASLVLFGTGRQRITTDLIAIEVEDGDGSRVITLPASELRALLDAVGREPVKWAPGRSPEGRVRRWLENALTERSCELSAFLRWEVLWEIQSIPRHLLSPEIDRLRCALMDAVAATENDGGPTRQPPTASLDGSEQLSTD